MDQLTQPRTPWQRIFSKFGMSQSDLARAIGCHRSKLSRHLNDDEGLISARDQSKLMNIARTAGVKLTAHDLLPRA